jgi:hypothetical protein
MSRSVAFVFYFPVPTQAVRLKLQIKARNFYLFFELPAQPAFPRFSRDTAESESHRATGSPPRHHKNTGKAQQEPSAQAKKGGRDVKNIIDASRSSSRVGQHDAEHVAQSYHRIRQLVRGPGTQPMEKAQAHQDILQLDLITVNIAGSLAERHIAMVLASHAECHIPLQSELKESLESRIREVAESFRSASISQVLWYVSVYVYVLLCNVFCVHACEDLIFCTGMK